MVIYVGYEKATLAIALLYESSGVPETLILPTSPARC